MHELPLHDRPLRVALIGLGAIGLRLAQQLQQHPSRVALVAVLVSHPERCATDMPALAPLVVDNLTQLLERQPDLVVECAGHSAVVAHGEAVLLGGSDLLLVSTGSLADGGVAERLQAAAAHSGRQLLLVAGALGGLDWLGAAQHAGLTEVTYRGRKPPQAWRGSPAEQVLALDTLQTAACFFRGSAREAAARFPRNANVAATLALATLGMERTQVELWADPGVTDNIHEVEAQGAAGHLVLKLQNQPDPDNPRTSLITAYSALRTILDRCSNVALAHPLALSNT